jgi:hypothetical protein
MKSINKNDNKYPKKCGKLKFIKERTTGNNDTKDKNKFIHLKNIKNLVLLEKKVSLTSVSLIKKIFNFIRGFLIFLARDFKKIGSILYSFVIKRFNFRLNSHLNVLEGTCEAQGCLDF